ncbi:MAG TPA: M23 family metallopeptidase [Microbacterium sp.]|nr:M23 family metallopeptidase [Microbacterium sp.]
MPRHPRSISRLSRAVLLCAILALCAGAAATPAAGQDALPTATRERGAAAIDLLDREWVWPAERFRLARGYVAPPHEYGPGHRGIDVRLLGTARVRAPADGVAAFTGSVAGRGILTIDHGDGLVTTLEPVETTLTPGAPVSRGEDVATLSTGGHTAGGTVHFGVRLNGAYINPMLLLGGVPRAVLLPCCA